MIACKVENNVPGGLLAQLDPPPVGLQRQRQTEFQPGQCMQCDGPSCVAACPVGATYKQDDGLVAIDPAKCIGCGNCVTACPYGARYRNPVRILPTNAIFVSTGLRRGEEPACVATCPTKARIFGDINDPEAPSAGWCKKKSWCG